MQKIIIEEIILTFFPDSMIIPIVMDFLIENNIEYITLSSKEQETIKAIFRSERDHSDREALIDFLRLEDIGYTKCSKMTCI